MTASATKLAASAPPLPDYPFLPALEPIGRGETTGRVAAALREAIVGLALPPGSDLDKNALCRRFGVSRFPVSEALGRLQAEGLIEILPQRGSRVSRIHLGEARQSMFIRRALEADTARAVALDPPDGLAAALAANIEAQRRAVASEDAQAFHRLDLVFHQSLIDALGYARVRAAVETARATLDRVRRLLSSPRRHALTLAEHEAIAAAVTAGDAEAAARAMARHLDAVIAELVEFAESRPTLFDDL